MSSKNTAKRINRSQVSSKDSQNSYTDPIKLLAWADGAATGTGFGVVSKYILGSLYKTGKYDIDHLAINFNADFIDKKIVPWNMQPAKLAGPRDPHGTGMFLRALVKGDYDLVWVCNDIHVTHDIAKATEKIIEEKRQQRRKVPKIIYYYPVDCHVLSQINGFVSIADIPVCYTDYGRQETIKTTPTVSQRLKQIPHGVNSSVFHPLSFEEIKSVRSQLLRVNDNRCVIVNVNRNSTRKQIQYSLLAFKEFKKYVPDSMYYIHTMITDQGGDLRLAIKELELDPGRDVIYPLQYSPQNPVPETTLNAIYNMGDIYLSTHLGEGWGLSITEAMSAGTPVVVPNNTCMPQLIGSNNERGYLYPCTDKIWIDASGFREKGVIPDIVSTMLHAYQDSPKLDNPKVKLARQFALEHDWTIIGNQWISLFDTVLSSQLTSIQSYGDII